MTADTSEGAFPIFAYRKATPATQLSIADLSSVERRPGRRRSTGGGAIAEATAASSIGTTGSTLRPRTMRPRRRIVGSFGGRGHGSSIMTGAVILVVLVLLFDGEEGGLPGIRFPWPGHHRGRTGLFSNILVSATTATSSGAVATSHDWEAGGIMVPLSPAGFQYTADVSISEGNNTLHLNMVVDTTTPLLGGKRCNDEDGDDASDGDGNGCITLQRSSEPVEDDQRQKKWKCNDPEVDNGKVCICPDECICEEIADAWLKEINREVTLGEDGGTMISLPEAKVLILPKISTESESTLDGWAQSDGVLGLSKFPASNCLDPSPDNSEYLPGGVENLSVFGELLSNLPGIDGEKHKFALDLGDADYSSTLEIGDYDREKLIRWGERYPASFPSGWIFQAFDPRVCGASLLDNISSSWPAVVSTASACLGLPSEMYNSLMSWVPVTGKSCADNGNIVCHFTNITAASELPWLSFRMSERGEQLYIPLSSLLIDDGPGGDQRLCVTRQGSIFGTSSAPFFLPLDQAYVTLGTLALRSLYVVVDVEKGKVGLAQKTISEASAEIGNKSCETAAVCVGSEEFKESDNSCSAPYCHLYFFYHLDDETKTCRARAGLRSLAWVLGTIFAVVELAGHFLRAYYGGTGIALRGHRHHQGWEFYTGKVLEYCLDKASVFTGVPTSGTSDHRDE